MKATKIKSLKQLNRQTANCTKRSSTFIAKKILLKGLFIGKILKISRVAVHSNHPTGVQDAVRSEGRQVGEDRRRVNWDRKWWRRLWRESEPGVSLCITGSSLRGQRSRRQ
ncbi:hypothetical protein pipiens_007215 [Culex pipiens pipiens]|uniref:Uncharacterized protein n=1 Tax=Culex pipiens pipiens TaxID=38569 RepID=A0ABD1DLS8_CULPP